jgi:hypothetical protein
MNRYKILTAEERTTSTGKQYKKAKIMDEKRGEHEVSVWSDFSQYTQISPERGCDRECSRKTDSTRTLWMNVPKAEATEWAQS